MSVNHVGVDVDFNAKFNPGNSVAGVNQLGNAAEKLRKTFVAVQRAADSAASGFSKVQASASTGFHGLNSQLTALSRTLSSTTANAQNLASVFRSLSSSTQLSGMTQGYSRLNQSISASGMAVQRNIASWSRLSGTVQDATLAQTRYMNGLSTSTASAIAGVAALLGYLRSVTNQMERMDVIRASYQRIMTANVGPVQIEPTMKEFWTDSIRLANEYGATIDDVAGTMVELARQGRTKTEIKVLTQQLAELRLMLATSTGKFMDMREAMQTAVTMTNQMGVSIYEAIDGLKLMSEYDIRAATSFKQISDALGRFAAAGRVGGMTMKEMVQVATAFTETGIKGTRAGTALNTILARISGQKKARDMLTSLGVSLVTLDNGAYRATSSLERLLEAYRKVVASGNQSMMQKFGEVFAGTRLQSVLFAGISQYNKQMMSPLNEEQFKEAVDNLKKTLQSTLSTIPIQSGLRIDSKVKSFDLNADALRITLKNGIDRVVANLQEEYKQRGTVTMPDNISLARQIFGVPPYEAEQIVNQHKELMDTITRQVQAGITPIEGVYARVARMALSQEDAMRKQREDALATMQNTITNAKSRAMVSLQKEFLDTRSIDVYKQSVEFAVGALGTLGGTVADSIKNAMGGLTFGLFGVQGNIRLVGVALELYLGTKLISLLNNTITSGISAVGSSAKNMIIGISDSFTRLFHPELLDKNAYWQNVGGNFDVIASRAPAITKFAQELYDAVDKTAALPDYVQRLSDAMIGAGDAEGKLADGSESLLTKLERLQVASNDASQSWNNTADAISAVAAAIEQANRVSTNNLTPTSVQGLRTYVQDMSRTLDLLKGQGLNSVREVGFMGGLDGGQWTELATQIAKSQGASLTDMSERVKVIKQELRELTIPKLASDIMDINAGLEATLGLTKDFTTFTRKALYAAEQRSSSAFGFSSPSMKDLAALNGGHPNSFDWPKLFQTTSGIPPLSKFTQKFDVSPLVEAANKIVEQNVILGKLSWDDLPSPVQYFAGLDKSGMKASYDELANLVKELPKLTQELDIAKKQSDAVFRSFATGSKDIDTSYQNNLHITYDANKGELQRISSQVASLEKEKKKIIEELENATKFERKFNPDATNPVLDKLISQAISVSQEQINKKKDELTDSIKAVKNKIRKAEAELAALQKEQGGNYTLTFDDGRVKSYKTLKNAEAALGRVLEGKAALAEVGADLKASIKSYYEQLDSLKTQKKTGIADMTANIKRELDEQIKSLQEEFGLRNKTIAKSTTDLEQAIKAEEAIWDSYIDRQVRNRHAELKRISRSMSKYDEGSDEWLKLDAKRSALQKPADIRREIEESKQFNINMLRTAYEEQRRAEEAEFAKTTDTRAKMIEDEITAIIQNGARVKEANNKQLEAIREYSEKEREELIRGRDEALEAIKGRQLNIEGGIKIGQTADEILKAAGLSADSLQALPKSMLEPLNQELARSISLSSDLGKAVEFFKSKLETTKDPKMSVWLQDVINKYDELITMMSNNQAALSFMKQTGKYYLSDTQDMSKAIKDSEILIDTARRVQGAFPAAVHMTLDDSQIVQLRASLEVAEQAQKSMTAATERFNVALKDNSISQNIEYVNVLTQALKDNADMSDFAAAHIKMLKDAISNKSIAQGDWQKVPHNTSVLSGYGLDILENTSGLEKYKPISEQKGWLDLATQRINTLRDADALVKKLEASEQGLIDSAKLVGSNVLGVDDNYQLRVENAVTATDNLTNALKQEIDAMNGLLPTGEQLEKWLSRIAILASAAASRMAENSEDTLITLSADQVGQVESAYQRVNTAINDVSESQSLLKQLFETTKLNETNPQEAERLKSLVDGVASSATSCAQQVNNLRTGIVLINEDGSKSILAMKSDFDAIEPSVKNLEDSAGKVVVAIRELASTKVDPVAMQELEKEVDKTADRLKVCREATKALDKALRNTRLDDKTRKELESIRSTIEGIIKRLEAVPDKFKNIENGTVGAKARFEQVKEEVSNIGAEVDKVSEKVSYWQKMGLSWAESIVNGISTITNGIMSVFMFFNRIMMVANMAQRLFDQITQWWADVNTGADESKKRMEDLANSIKRAQDVMNNASEQHGQLEKNMTDFGEKLQVIPSNQQGLKILGSSVAEYSARDDLKNNAEASQRAVSEAINSYNSYQREYYEKAIKLGSEWMEKNPLKNVAEYVKEYVRIQKDHHTEFNKVFQDTYALLGVDIKQESDAIYKMQVEGVKTFEDLMSRSNANDKEIAEQWRQLRGKEGKNGTLSQALPKENYTPAFDEYELAPEIRESIRADSVAKDTDALRSALDAGEGSMQTAELNKALSEISAGLTLKTATFEQMRQAVATLLQDDSTSSGLVLDLLVSLKTYQEKVGQNTAVIDNLISQVNSAIQKGADNEKIKTKLDELKSVPGVDAYTQSIADAKNSFKANEERIKKLDGLIADMENELKVAQSKGDKSGAEKISKTLEEYVRQKADETKELSEQMKRKIDEILAKQMEGQFSNITGYDEDNQFDTLVKQLDDAIKEWSEKAPEEYNKYKEQIDSIRDLIKNHKSKILVALIEQESLIAQAQAIEEATDKAIAAGTDPEIVERMKAKAEELRTKADETLSNALNEGVKAIEGAVDTLMKNVEDAGQSILGAVFSRIKGWIEKGYEAITGYLFGKDRSKNPESKEARNKRQDKQAGNTSVAKSDKYAEFLATKAGQDLVNDYGKTKALYEAAQNKIAELEAQRNRAARSSSSGSHKDANKDVLSEMLNRFSEEWAELKIAFQTVQDADGEIIRYLDRTNTTDYMKKQVELLKEQQNELRNFLGSSGLSAEVRRKAEKELRNLRLKEVKLEVDIELKEWEEKKASIKREISLLQKQASLPVDFYSDGKKNEKLQERLDLLNKIWDKQIEIYKKEYKDAVASGDAAKIQNAAYEYLNMTLSNTSKMLSDIEEKLKNIINMESKKAFGDVDFTSDEMKQALQSDTKWENALFNDPFHIENMEAAEKAMARMTDKYSAATLAAQKMMDRFVRNNPTLFGRKGGMDSLERALDSVGQVFGKTQTALANGVSALKSQLSTAGKKYETERAAIEKMYSGNEKELGTALKTLDENFNNSVEKLYIGTYEQMRSNVQNQLSQIKMPDINKFTGIDLGKIAKSAGIRTPLQRWIDRKADEKIKEMKKAGLLDNADIDEAYNKVKKELAHSKEAQQLKKEGVTDRFKSILPTTERNLAMYLKEAAKVAESYYQDTLEALRGPNPASDPRIEAICQETASKAAQDFYEKTAEVGQEMFKRSRELIINNIKDGWDEAFEIGYEYGDTVEGWDKFKEMMKKRIAKSLSDALYAHFHEYLEEVVKTINDTLVNAATSAANHTQASNKVIGLGQDFLLPIFSSLIGGLIGMAIGSLFSDYTSEIEKEAEAQLKQQRDAINAQGFSWSYSKDNASTPYYEFSPPVTQESVKVIKFSSTFNITTDAAMAMASHRRELERVCSEIIENWMRAAKKTVGASA